MIGKLIIHMRTTAGHSQRSLAKKLNIDQTTLSAYERGATRPSAEMLELIARVCEFEILLRDKNSNEVFDIKGIRKL